MLYWNILCEILISELDGSKFRHEHLLSPSYAVICKMIDNLTYYCTSGDGSLDARRSPVNRCYAPCAAC